MKTTKNESVILTTPIIGPATINIGKGITKAADGLFVDIDSFFRKMQIAIKRSLADYPIDHRYGFARIFSNMNPKTFQEELLKFSFDDSSHYLLYYEDLTKNRGLVRINESVKMYWDFKTAEAKRRESWVLW